MDFEHRAALFAGRQIDEKNLVSMPRGRLKATRVGEGASG
jgi:hypothetical protein